jgi:adenylate cyclase
VLMLDIRGFTKVSQTLSARETVQVLTSFHSTIVPLVAAHNGVIDKFLGDGVMITFGAVKPSHIAAADALRALDSIIAASVKWTAAQAAGGTTKGQPLEVNGAAVAGPVVFAALGNGQRLEFTVIGDAANLAAKLEKHNKALGCRALTTTETWDLAVSQGYIQRGKPRARTASSVAGVTGSIDLVKIA